MVLRHRLDRFERLGIAGVNLGFALAVTAVVIAASLFIAKPVQAWDQSVVNFGAEHDLADGAFALAFGNFDEGIRLTQKGLEAPPPYHDRSAALSNLCAGFVGNGEFQLAVVHCTSALDINEKNWQAYNNRGYAHFKLGDFEAAESDINRGLELKPNAHQLKQIKSLVAQR